MGPTTDIWELIWPWTVRHGAHMQSLWWSCRWSMVATIQLMSLSDWLRLPTQANFNLPYITSADRCQTHVCNSEQDLSAPNYEASRFRKATIVLTCAVFSGTRYFNEVTGSTQDRLLHVYIHAMMQLQGKNAPRGLVIKTVLDGLVSPYNSAWPSDEMI